jgi:hypothetical protein
MSITATFPIVGRENHRDEPNNILKPARHPNVAENTMPPRRHADDNDVDEFTLRESMHVQTLANTSMCRAIETLATAMTAQASAQAVPKTNGQSNRSTIIAALLISFIPQAFGVVWWTRGTERDTASRVGTVELKMDQYEKRETIREREVRLLQQYNMNLQLWMRERGIKGAPMPPKLDIDKEN